MASLLAIAGTGTDVELWDPAANELVASLPTPERVSSIAFAPTGDLLAIGQPEALNFWKVVEPEVRSRASGFESTPSSLAFAPDGCLALAFRGEAPPGSGTIPASPAPPDPRRPAPLSPWPTTTRDD